MGAHLCDPGACRWVFGFFSLAGLAASIAKILFLIFLVLLVASFVMRALRGQSVV